MNIHGRTLSFPFRADQRGSLAVVSDPVEMAEQFLRDLIETLITERVMLPGYGMRDYVFAVKDAVFTVALASDLEEQARDYLPILNFIEVKSGERSDDGVFNPGFPLDPYRAAISVNYRIAGESNERNLVFPTFQYRGEV